MSLYNPFQQALLLYGGGGGGGGFQGPVGVQGLQGSSSGGGGSGTQGLQGIAGVQGIIGRQGAVGSGNQGVQGTVGTSGSPGAAGVQGVQGLVGPTGSGGGGGGGAQIIDISYVSKTAGGYDVAADTWVNLTIPATPYIYEIYCGGYIRGVYNDNEATPTTVNVEGPRFTFGTQVSWKPQGGFGTTDNIVYRPVQMFLRLVVVSSTVQYLDYNIQVGEAEVALGANPPFDLVQTIPTTDRTCLSYRIPFTQNLSTPKQFFGGLYFENGEGADISYVQRTSYYVNRIPYV